MVIDLRCTEEALALGRAMNLETAIKCLRLREVNLKKCKHAQNLKQLNLAVRFATQAQLYREAVEEYLRRPTI